MLDAECVKKNINARFDSILYTSKSGIVRPCVCLVCDEFLKPNEVETVSLQELKKVEDILKPKEWNAAPLKIREHYTYIGDCGDQTEEEEEELEWMYDMMLSPRGCYVRDVVRRRKKGFAVCSKCKMSLSKCMMPHFAIANNYAFGAPPSCLLELTEVELAMLTPVKTFGYCFAYTGGCNKQLKGSLSYFKVAIIPFFAIRKLVKTGQTSGWRHQNEDQWRTRNTRVRKLVKYRVL